MGTQCLLPTIPNAGLPVGEELKYSQRKWWDGWVTMEEQQMPWIPPTIAYRFEG